MTTKAWAHLPNAAHIDRMLASVKKNPERWSTARDMTHDAAWDEARQAAWDVARGALGGAVGGEARHKAWDEAWDAAWNAVQGAAWGAARDVICDAAWSAARGGVKPISRDEAWNAAWHAARGTVLALIAWDDCAYILELPEDALKVLRAVGNEQAILLSAAAHALRETSC